MAQITMTNTTAVQERESTFSMEKITKGYQMTFESEIINTESENEADVVALMYKLEGSGNTFQRFGIYSFRRNVKFVNDTAENRKTVRKLNKLVSDVITTKGHNAVYSDFSQALDLLNSLEFINPFVLVEGKENIMTVPDSITIIGVHPKFNAGLFDTPSSKAKLRYTTRSYKANSYKQADNGEFVIDKEGESLSYMARSLANEEKYEEIISLYESAEVDQTAAKEIKNVIFNNAICICS